MANAGDQLIGLIPVAIGAKIIENVLETKPRKNKKHSKGLSFD